MSPCLWIQTDFSSELQVIVKKRLCLSFSVPRANLSQLGPPAASPSTGLVGPSLQLEQPGRMPPLLLLVSLYQSSPYAHLCEAILWLWPGRPRRSGRRKPSYTGSPCFLIPAPPPGPHPHRRGGVSPLSSCCRSTISSPSPSYAAWPLCSQEGPQSSIARTAPSAAGPRTPAPSTATTPPAAPHDAPCSPKEEELLWGDGNQRWRWWRWARQSWWIRSGAPRL